MHFGIYLQRKGTISTEQLVNALAAQLEQRVRIGQLALEEGILSARDIFTILQSQQRLPLERFGEIAVELGLMSRDDLMRLLLIQSDRQRPLIEILVKQGAVTDEMAAAELFAYRMELVKPATRVRTTMLPPRTRASEPSSEASEVTAV